jgi:protocatechuate 3,4-dioxygenase beta subunit
LSAAAFGRKWQFQRFAVNAGFAEGCIMKIFRQSVFVFAFAVLACQMRAADNGATSQFTGTVLDEKGQPVAGATVDFYQYQSSWGWFGGIPWNPEVKQHAITDSSGGFAISSPFGASLVVVKKPGFAPAWKNWNSSLADSSEPLVLTAPTTLSGLVVDDNDKPVAGAEVWVSNVIVGEVFSESQFNNLSGQAARDCFSARTGTDGRFLIENFPADGHASLTVSKPGKAQHPIGNTYLGSRDFQSGQNDIELLLGPAGGVDGKVKVQETGQPFAGAKVWLTSTTGNGNSPEPVRSGADGTFRVPDVAPGSYNVMSSISDQMASDWVVVPGMYQGLVMVKAGETTNCGVIQVSKGALVEVTVVVTNELAPIANALMSADGFTAYSDSNGVALLRMPAGTNWFSARKDWRSQNKTAVIEAGQTNHIRIELTPPPRIAGTVRDPSGAPVAGALVSFHPGQYPDAPDYAEVLTDSNGRYELSLKLTREFGFWSGPISPTNFVMARSLERNLVAIQEFDVFPTDLDLTLQPGITLSGSVKDTEGAPVTNATVDISMLSGHSFARLWPHPIKVDAQGSFTFPALPQGREYYFFQGITAKGHGTAGGHLKAEDSKTNHYEFPAFVLKRANQILAGQVLGQDGKPVGGATINLGGQGQLLWHSTKSDSQGLFGFDKVCEGDLTVSANHENDQGNVPAKGGDTNVVIRLGIYLVNYGKISNPLLKTTGIVRDPSGIPAAGVTVSLFPVQGSAFAIYSQTGSDGRYEFTWQAHTGLEESHWLLARDLKRNLAAIHQVDKKMTNLDITLQEGLTLSVQVRDSSGQAVTNATGMATIWSDPQRGYSLNQRPVPTDKYGHLRITSLPRGNRYWIQIEAPGHTSDTLHIVSDETEVNLLELPPAVLELTDRNVSGRVLDVDGKPAANIDLTLFAAGQIGKRTMTDSEGHFLFQEVKRGAVSISAGLPVNGVAPGYRGSASAKGGDTNVVIRLTVNNNRQVFGTTITTSGTVFGPSGVPAPGVLLAMLPSGGLRSPVRSDANGKYTLQWQATSVRTASAMKAMIVARDPEHNLAATDDMEVTTTNLDLYLRPGFTLSGSVEDSNGNPVTNAIMQLVVNPSTNRASRLNQMPPTNTSPDGLFSINALPQGMPYSVQISASGYGSSNVTVLAADTKTQRLKLPAIVLNFGNKQVTGQVLGLDGKPCWGAQISISGNGQPLGSPGGAATSDAKGHFVVRQVCEGLLTVRATLPANATNPRYLVSTVQAHGGDKYVVLKLHYP